MAHCASVTSPTPTNISRDLRLGLTQSGLAVLAGHVERSSRSGDSETAGFLVLLAAVSRRWCALKQPILVVHGSSATRQQRCKVAAQEGKNGSNQQKRETE
jgi:hypothetical protein